MNRWQLKLKELAEEFRLVAAAGRSWIDALVPPLVFVLLNLLFGIRPAVGGAIGLAAVVTTVRLMRHDPLRYALGGLAGASLASLVAIGLSRGEGYFLPGMVSGAATAIACLVSVLLRRPLAAWSSFVTRRWPIEWYWHPKVRPAYSDVTLLWFSFFSVRLAIQVFLFQRGATLALSTANLILGWPSLVLLLAASYLYGLWRLRALEGPSVQEFRDHAPPPWTGQKRGF